MWEHLTLKLEMKRSDIDISGICEDKLMIYARRNNRGARTQLWDTNNDGRTQDADHTLRWRE